MSLPLNTSSPQYAGLHAVWPLEEGTGNPVDSFTSTAGTRVGSTLPTWFTHSFRNGLSFNGSNYVDCNRGSINISTDFSFAAWMRSTQTGADRWMVTHGDTGAGGGFVGLIMQSGVLRFNVRNAAGANTFNVAGSATINDGNWHHVVGVQDGTTARLYVDGSADGTAAITLPGSTVFATTSLGALRRTSVSSYYTGDLGDVRIYSRALSASDVTDLYNDPWDLYDVAAPGSVGLVGSGLVGNNPLISIGRGGLIS